MKCNSARIGDVASFRKVSIKPDAGTIYHCYSLPAFDNARKPEILDGSEILSNKLHIENGDILVNKLNMRFKRIWPINSLQANSVCSTEFVPLCPNEKVDRNYLLYILMSDDFTNALSGMRTGTSGSHQRVKPEWILDYKFPLPSIEKQRRIGSFLSSLDQKIAINTKLNGYLEEMLAIKFSDLISGSDCRRVPLSEIIHFQEGPGIRNWQYVYDGTGVDFINIRCIQNHDLNLADANQISVEEAYGKYSHFLVNSGDILMSTSGTLGRYAIARPEHLPLCMNTSVIRFKPLNDPAAYAFVYGYLTSREFYKHLLGMANGSAQVNFGPTHLKKIEIPWPGAIKVHAFNETSMPLIDEMNCLHSESKKLAALRDTLLPKLITGKIDVSRVDITQLNSHLA